MNVRTTYLLLGTVLLGLLGLVIYVFTASDETPNPLAEGYLLRPFKAAGITSDKITTVEIEYPGQTPEVITFVQENKTWKMTAPAKARADQATMESIVNAVLNAKVDKTAEITPNLAAHGLETPSAKLTLKAGTLNTTVLLGDLGIGGDRAVIYVMTTDKGAKIQACKRNDFAPLFKGEFQKGGPAGSYLKTLSDFRPLKLLGDGLVDAVNQVRSFRVIDGKEELALFRPLQQNVWRFRIPADFGDAEPEADANLPAIKDNKIQITSVRQLLNEIMNIRPGDAKQLIEKPGDLSKYGLDPNKSKPLQISMTRDDGFEETLFVGDPVKVDNTDRYYARYQGDNLVAEVNATAVRTVRGVLAAKYLLRDRTVGKVLPPRVDAIDVNANGETFELRQINNQWRVFDSEGYGRPVKRAMIDELLGTLTKKSLATGFPNAEIPEDRRGFTKPLVEVKVWEGGINKDANPDPTKRPTIEAPATMTFQFGNKDVGDVVFLRRITGDSKSDFYVPLTSYSVAEKPRLEYIDATFKPFDVDPVLKYTFTFGKETLELERHDDGKPLREAAWKFVSPANLVDRPVDLAKLSELIMTVAIMRPTKIAADRPKDDVLNRLQLNPTTPRAKLTVKHKELGTITYDFGAEAGVDKKNIYLKTGVDNIVYEVDKTVFDRIANANVQNTVIHQIDQAKIKSLKISGWQATIGERKTLEIDRKDGKWSLKAGGMFEIDPKKVDQLVSSISTPSWEKTIVQKTGAKPEHNLDPAKNALEIELDLEGNGKVTIQISPPDAAQKIFMTSSLAAGDVYLLPDAFSWLRDKPTGLK